MNSSAMTSQKQNKGEISLDDHSLKIRKPYTISKQRERWTDDEHKKFIEALKLYGRAWRRIEEHVGTKTAVQIRSHAQKFFSKVVREDTTTSDKPIEIPPPRPKRKPMHPYPRKLVLPIKASNLSGPTLIVEQESCSPTSVLSTVGSDSVNVSPNIDEEAIQKLESGFLKENSVEVSSCYRSLKLFGKTMVVKKNGDVSNDVSDLPWFMSPRVYSPTPIKPCDKDKETQQEGSSSGSNIESVIVDGGSQSLGLSLGNEKKQEKTFLPLRRMNNKKGFLPYKRCLAERDEEMDVQQRLRLCL